MTANRNLGSFVSFWRLRGMPSGLGPPTDWLPTLSRRIVNLQCECPPAVVAWPATAGAGATIGHLDQCKSRDEILTAIQALAGFNPLEIGRQLRCDTSSELDVALLAKKISEALERP